MAEHTVQLKDVIVDVTHFAVGHIGQKEKQKKQMMQLEGEARE